MKRMACVLTVFGLSLAAATAASVQFSIIGDFGTDDANELAVANLVKTNFQPQFIVTVGDNNYIGAANIDDAIGKYYHQFIGNYSGGYGAGASSNRFFPALGNHDYASSGGYSAHTNYFTLPGNERYYDFVRGPVHIFILNSDPNEPDGTSATSKQALWFSNRIASSTSPWKVVVCQDGPYSSTEPHTWMEWPLDQWGAHIVVSGDSHQYERIMRGGIAYVVNGAGGAALAGFGTPTMGSSVRYQSAHGAMKVIATETNITYEFWSVANGGTLIDRFTQGPQTGQSTPPALSIMRTNNSMRVSWPTNSGGAFLLQSTVNLSPVLWSNVAAAPVVSGTRFVTTVPRASNGNAFFRLTR